MTSRTPAAPGTTNTSERRRHLRAKVLWTGSLDHGGRTSDCVLLNIGARGAMARAVQAPPKDGTATLRSFHFGRLSGKIVWRDGNAFGLRFEQSPAEIRKVIGWQLPELSLDLSFP